MVDTDDYRPLTAYLTAHPANEVTLTFAELETLLGASLPDAAWQRAWWANTETPQGRTWLAAGWVVRWVRQRGEEAAVTFVRRWPARPKRLSRR